MMSLRALVRDLRWRWMRKPRPRGIWLDDPRVLRLNPEVHLAGSGTGHVIYSSYSRTVKDIIQRVNDLEHGGIEVTTWMTVHSMAEGCTRIHRRYRWVAGINPCT